MLGPHVTSVHQNVGAAVDHEWHQHLQRGIPVGHPQPDQQLFIGQIATLTGVPMAGSYLQLVDSQPGGLGVIGLPHLDAGPFLSYGIQWITFGVVAPILLGYFVYAEIRARRAEKSQTLPAGPAEPATVEEKLIDRYGRRR